MRYLIPALVATVAGFSMARADPAKTAPFADKSFGDGGGYKHPDAAVGGYLETVPQPAADHKPGGQQAPAKVEPAIRPVAAPSRPRPRPRPFADDRAIGEEMPLPKSVGKAVAAPSAAEVEPDSVSDEARRDYETRLFGVAPAPRRPGLEGSEGSTAAGSVLPAAIGEGMLFVSLELDPQEAGTLRDAVAGLGESAAFRPDARFQPIPGEGGSVRITGWLPASRLGDAIARPGVKRVAVETGFRPARDKRVTGDYLLTLRVTDPARAEESISVSVRELTTETGFELRGVPAVHAVPGGGATALVSGTMPVSQLARALGLRGVVKIDPALPASAVPAAPAEAVEKEGFFKFVLARSFWLVMLTALLALPAVGGAVKKVLAVFVPYR